MMWSCRQLPTVALATLLLQPRSRLTQTSPDPTGSTLLQSLAQPARQSLLGQMVTPWVSAGLSVLVTF